MNATEIIAKKAKQPHKNELREAIVSVGIAIAGLACLHMIFGERFFEKDDLLFDASLQSSKISIVWRDKIYAERYGL